MSKQLYSATIFGPATRTISGKVVAQDENNIVVNYKRPRSAKFEQAVFPRSNVLYSAVGEDGSIELVIAEQRAELETVKVAPGSIVVGALTTTFETENGDTYTVGNSAVQFVGEAEEASTKKKAKADKAEKGEKKKGKKGKKKAK